jgi:hypothetical protein
MEEKAENQAEAFATELHGKDTEIRTRITTEG